MNRYEQGFLTKCAEYGIDGRELLKHAYEEGKYTRRRGNVVKAVTSLGGAAAGTAIGALIGGKKGRLLRKTLGALGGGAVGYGAGAVSNGIRGYLGFDPMLSTESIAKQ